MKTLLALSALALLAACASTPGSTGRTDWSCGGGAAFSVRFQGSAAEVFAGGQIYRLPRVAGASGLRYSNGSVEYRESGGQATVGGARGGPYNNCRRG